MMGARLRIADDGCGRLHVRWWADEGGLWRAVLADFKATFRPHGERSYNSTTRTWSVPLRGRRRLEEWADYWFDAGAQQWDDPEPDGRTYGRHADGDDRGGTTRAGSSALAEAYARLHLVRDAPLWAAEVMYKAAIKQHHPDVGGDHDTAVALTEAITLIRGRTERSA